MEFFFFSSGFPNELYLGRPRDGEGLHLNEGVGPLGGEVWLVLVTEDPVGQRELDLGVVELLGCCSAALVGCDLLYLHDLDPVGPGKVPGAHVSVALGGGAGCGQVPVLPVHVVGASAGVIVQPDAEVLQPWEIS